MGAACNHIEQVQSSRKEFGGEVKDGRAERGHCTAGAIESGTRR